MENERFQELVLNHLSHLTEQITGIEGDITDIREDVSGIKGDITRLKEDVTGIKGDITGLKDEFSSIRKIVINIEYNHGEKLAALFDGLAQNNEKIDRFKDELLEQIDDVRVDTRYLVRRVSVLEKIVK